jgi:hypothetical protein
MATAALAQFLRVFSGSTDQLKLQNYFIGQTVDSYDFGAFETSGTIVSTGTEQTGLTLTFPYSKSRQDFADQAFANGWLVEMTMYQFNPDTPSAKTLIARMVGEVVSIESNLQVVALTVGSSLEPIGAQIPPRKYTTTLVGTPPTL